MRRRNFLKGLVALPLAGCASKVEKKQSEYREDIELEPHYHYLWVPAESVKQRMDYAWQVVLLGDMEVGGLNERGTLSLLRVKL